MKLKKFIETMAATMVVAATIAPGAQAAPAMVDAGLWQSAKLGDLNISFSPVTDPELFKGCNDWLEIAGESSNFSSLANYATQFDNWRKTPGDNATVEGGFQMPVLFSSQQLNEQLSTQRENANRFLKTMDGHFLLAVEQFNVNMIGSIVVVPSENSLSGFARVAGLPQSQFNLKSDGLIVYGRDLACDLLQGRAYVKIVAGAETDVPTVDVDARLNDLKYLVIATNYALAKKSSPVARAAYLGMKISRALRNETDEVVDHSIEEIVGRFFNADAMTPNSVWSNEHGALVLKPQYRSFYNVNVIVRGAAPTNDPSLQR